MKYFLIGAAAGYIAGLLLPMTITGGMRMPRPPGMTGNPGVPEGPGFYRP